MLLISISYFCLNFSSSRYQTQYALAAEPARPHTNTPALNLDKRGNIAEGMSSAAASSSTCTSSKSNAKGTPKKYIFLNGLGDFFTNFLVIHFTNFKRI